MKLFSLPNLNIKSSRLLISKTHLKPRTVTSTPTYRQIESNFASLNSIYSDPFFPLLGFCKTISSLKKIHALVITYGQTNNILVKTKLLGLYGLFGQVTTARVLFDDIPNPDLSSCKVMIRWYFMNDKYADVIGFFNCFRKTVNIFDNVVFSIVLKACSGLHDFVEGRKVHCHIVKVGNADSFVLTGLVDMYAKCGEVESSCEVFEGIAQRNVVCWTSMIVGYMQNGCAEEALVLFNRMRDGAVEGNEYTLGSIVTACAKLAALHQGKWIHGYIIKKQGEFNSYLVSALVDMYVKCGDLTDARSILFEFSEADLVSWTAMIVGYTQNGYPDEALDLFVHKKWEAVLPNSVTVSSVVSACAQLDNLNLGTSIHGLGIKLRLDDAAVINALVHMYGKCGMKRDARYLFENVSHKDVIAWNSIISGYSSNDSAHDAIALFHQMRSECLQPDATTMVSVLTACASHGALIIGSSLHAYCIKGGLLSSTYIGTALLNFYAKCGDAKSARAIFDRMVEKSRVTWSAMIGGYGMQGDFNNSLAILNDMMGENLEPNDIIFTAILSACSHTGMILEGWSFFANMCENYKFVPTIKHYACMIDLLARAGRLEEAFDFMNKMPIQPDVSLFGAFLNGCSIYSRFDLGELAVRRMLELHPRDACYYVLMANLYASDGRWNQAHQMRNMMRIKGVKKSPGFSNFNVNFDSDFYTPQVASLP
ncbi:pentatricopeptide repeat-containing protein At2g03380, mitochondrial [Coffea eugenioides]|uniref:pentatricopeptide repeat-containing protein At2g03380, mitochondrial n=1 Tax=Coffea eugenioides TaxID=49369 RepID=UPI000F607EA4|nr:pentatricopeptide repeat-containing protein At2g03380, mitochondrial [Coffea eugenioides]XP_027151224.1 pentatricopeptide repeat-containing protein At2g03380, mitochondrial [Coffea eugenioides]